MPNASDANPLCVCCQYERRYREDRVAHGRLFGGEIDPSIDYVDEIGRVFAVGVGVGLALHHENVRVQEEISIALCERHRVAMRELHDQLKPPAAIDRLFGRVFPL